MQAPTRRDVIACWRRPESMPVNSGIRICRQDLGRRHATYYRRLTSEALHELSTKTGVSANRNLKAQLDNVREARLWWQAVDQTPHRSLRWNSSSAVDCLITPRRSVIGSSNSAGAIRTFLRRFTRISISIWADAPNGGRSCHGLPIMGKVTRHGCAPRRSDGYRAGASLSGICGRKAAGVCTGALAL